MLKIIIHIVKFIVIFALGWLSTKSKNDLTDNFLLSIIGEYRGWIVGFLSAIVAILQNDVFYFPKRQFKKIREQMLENMYEQLFKKDSDIRITVFKDANWFRNSLINIKIFLGNVINLTKRYLFKKYPENGDGIGIKDLFRWNKYIVIKNRVAKEYKKSKTFFKIAKNTRSECEGIASMVRYEKQSILAQNLPNIESINLEHINLRRKTQEVKMVKEYMSKGYINNMETLKRLNRKARHIYGTVIPDRNGNFIGVLIIDCFADTSPFNDENIVSRIDSYAQSIGLTF